MTGGGATEPSRSEPGRAATTWTDPVGVGVIGHGFMGKTHIQCYLSAQASGFPCEVYGIAATSPIVLLDDGAGGNIARREGRRGLDLSRVRLHDNYRALLDDPAIELVSACTPTPSHMQIARDALLAGKRVLVEKPVALSSREIGVLAGEDSLGLVMPAMCVRYWPGWVELREAVARGALAKGAVARGEAARGEKTGVGQRLRSLHLHRVGERPGWSPFYADNRQCGGALFDLHLHDTDFVYHCLGAPSEVESTGHEDDITTRYRFADLPDVNVTARGAWVRGEPFQMRFEAVFEGGGRMTYDISRQPAFTTEGIGAGARITYSTGYDGEVIAALGSCRGTPYPISLHEAAAVARVIEAERESLGSGRAVPIPSGAAQP